MKATRSRTRLSPAARRAQLLATAKNMVIANGLQAFTMEGLAREASVSAPLVYNYFDSRLDTLRSLLAREYEAYGARLTEDVEQAEDFETVVRLSIESNFDYYAPGNIIPVLESQPEIAVAERP